MGTPAGTPHSGEAHEPCLESARSFPFPWGDRYFLADIIWNPDGTRSTHVCTTSGADLSQEAEDFVVEFLNTLQEGAPIAEVAQTARNVQPCKYEQWLQYRRMWPWTTQNNTFFWLGSFLETVSGYSR